MYACYLILELNSREGYGNSSSSIAMVATKSVVIGVLCVTRVCIRLRKRGWGWGGGEKERERKLQKTSE